MLFELGQVAEVDEPPVTWPIPSAPPCYPGAMNFHGSIVAVLDAAAFLDGITPYLPPEKLIVLDSSLASLALLVEQVVRIVPATQAGPVIEQDKGCSVGTFTLPEGMVTLLDAVRIVQLAEETING